MLKSLADDTRLRIINLLNKGELNVTDMCGVLGSSQSNLSKHLARLRLTGVVNDKRKGFHVYYFLAKPASRAHKKLVNAIIMGLAESEVFKEDIEKLKKLKKKCKNRM
jgi:ArsR family transcriptional regulator